LSRASSFVWLYARPVRRPSKNRHAVVLFVALATLSARALGAAPILETPPDVKDCPSAGDLRRVLTSQLGRDDLDDARSPRVLVRIRRTNEGLAADVTVTMANGTTSTRTIEEGDACGDLVRAAALTVALAIERDAAKEKEREKEKEKEQEKAPEPPRVVEQPPSSDRPIRSDRAAISVAGVTSIGLLPRPSAGAAASARVRVSEVLWASARGFWLPSGAMPNDEFSLRLFGAGPGVCAEPIGSTSVAAVGCAHVILGAYDVVRAAVPLRSGGAEAYVAGSLFAGARAKIAGPLHLEGGVDAQIPFVRPTYVTQACPPVGFEPPFTALALWLGAGISLR
jgi:hypothetical protein